MAPSLNKLFFIFFLFAFADGFSQSDVSSIYAPKDYKETEQFKHFYKRREAVGRWQINQLKTGALVVRLHDNKNLIDKLKKMGQADLALEKEHESFAVNKNIIRAFTKYYTFSKVYFFYSHNSDSLFRGFKEGIFLDTNLNIDRSIVLTEKFFLLAEKDFAYNSSIGFVPEDTAKYCTETGNAVNEMGIVVKNKYGHQLKDPFPHLVDAKGNPDAKAKESVNFEGKIISVLVNKRFLSQKYSMYVQKLNSQFAKFYETNKGYEVTDPDVKPFLY